MDEGKTPAPWFLDVNGQKQGPYTSEQIMKLLMDGALNVESKIFDSAADTWKIAADVIPYLEVQAAGALQSGARLSNERSWQPPPKPTELKDVHVAPLNTQVTGEVDYFALINHQRKEIERSRTSTARVQSMRELEEEKQRRAQNGGRTAPSPVRRIEGPKIIRVAPPIEQVAPTKLAAATTVPTPALAAALSAKPGDGIFTAEAQPTVPLGLGNVVLFTRRTIKFIQTHKSAVSLVAGLCFVFIGTYGVVRTLSDRKGREPANIQANVNETSRDAATTTPSVALTTPKVGLNAGDDALGSGRHRVTHSRPGLSRLADRAQQAAPTPLSSEPSNANREPPQYYSSADPGTQPQNAPIQDNGNTMNPVAAIPGNPLDPNVGLVNPPAYIPPPGNDPNADPSGNPAAVNATQ